ncbi:hypothetical protein [Pseudoalteromonas sp. MMG005]|uniref:hypothetical protein n=1 Tax=Pseudoalteromonas sp. MMG005 TaxID=2822682 RepID=UPI001B3A6E37|nr:hypothetical protein [Pseudoalteromonas sp. MMG005]MBQ4844449.1 hypothetical protein [Pseudoalteromonas sp. MMG005]
MTLLDIIIELPKEGEFNFYQLTDCQFLSHIFRVQITALDNKEQTERRLVSMRGHQFTERVIQLSDTSLTYQIEGNGPIKLHLGEINYTNSNTQHFLHYKISGTSNTWLPSWLLKAVLYYDFKRAGKRLWSVLNES